MMLVKFFVLLCVYFVISFSRVVGCLEFKYHSNQELAEILHMFNESVNWPLRANVYSVGSTIDGNELWVAEVTAADEEKLKVPNIKLIGNIHGNEVVGREVLLHFLHYLRDQYHNGNNTITSLLNTTKIHILPAMNPDGFSRSKKNCDTDDGRHNGKGHIDLNRSFPGTPIYRARKDNKNKAGTVFGGPKAWQLVGKCQATGQDPYHRNPVKPQPETIAIMNWMEQVPFVLSASLHGGAMVANYPYDSIKEKSSNYHLEDQASLTPDDDVFKHLSKVYSNNHKEMHLGHACNVSNTKFTEGIVNGASWYSFVGGMQDYNYFKHGCMELTLEISCCKYPGAEHLEKYWQDNREALVVFCQQVHRGIYGQVLDRETNEPITGARLEISGRNMSFSTFKDTGEFWRILLPGKYSIKVQAAGYYDQTLLFEIDPEQMKLEMDILLTNSSVSTTSSTTVSTHPTEELEISSVVSIGSNEAAEYTGTLCDMETNRSSRAVECGYPEVGEILVNSARSCFFSMIFLIALVLVFLIYR